MLLLLQSCLNHGFISHIGVIHAGAVLGAAIVALLVEAGGVNDAEIVLQDVVEAEPICVVDDLDGFGMARVAAHHVFVRRVFGLAVGVAGNGIHHAGDALEIGFHAPETAAGKVDGVCIHGVYFHAEGGRYFWASRKLNFTILSP